MDIQDVLLEIRWGLGEKKPASWTCLIGALMVLVVIVLTIVNVWFPLSDIELLSKIVVTMFTGGAALIIIGLIFVTMEA